MSMQICEFHFVFFFPQYEACKYVCPGQILWLHQPVMYLFSMFWSLCSLANQILLQDLVSAANPQIEFEIKTSLTFSSRYSLLCADLKFIFLSCSTSREYSVNNREEPLSTWHSLQIHSQGDAFITLENGLKTITWNMLQSCIVLKTSNFASAHRTENSLLSIFLTTYIGFDLSLNFSCGNSTMQVAFLKNSSYCNCSLHYCIGKTTNLVIFAFSTISNTVKGNFLSIPIRKLLN